LEPITYRQFAIADARAVQAVARDAWHHAYAQLFGPQAIDDQIDRDYAPASLQALVPELESGKACFLVAVDEGQVIGFCLFRIAGRGPELCRLYLHPCYTGRGIASTLVGMGEAFLRKQGVNRYFCFVNKGNVLGQQFYRKQGFRHVAEGDLSDVYYLEKVLE
jgi:ribosomal protein S18 acetylase RimI-like enzyme